MRICACLCWFDETPKMLRQCVGSLAGVADCLAALDGPFASYPDSNRRRRSPKIQAETIRKTASDAGLLARVESEPRAWETQPIKRSHLVELARSYFGLKPEDWLLVIDADEYVDLLRPDWRGKLERLSPDKRVALVQGESWTRIPRLLRALPGLAYDGAHNRIVVDGEVIVYGSPTGPTGDVSGYLRLMHNRNGRRRERNINANLYRLARRETGER